jgi:hypothetical protein
MSLLNLHPTAIDKLVLEQYASGWDKYEPQGTKIFKTVTPERFNEQFSIVAADGSIQESAELAAYPTVQVEEVGKKQLSQLIFKKEIGVGKHTMNFDNYGTILEEAQKLGYHARVKIDQLMADVMNSVEDAGQTVWDGLSIANSAHKIGKTGQTQSNIVTGAFGETTVNAAKNALNRQKDHAGLPNVITPATLVIPPELEQKVFELLKSQNDPESGNRNTNFFMGFANYVVWSLLDSAEDFHVFADPMFHKFLYLPSMNPEINVVESSEQNGARRYQIDFACQAGAVDYLGYIFGNAA